MNKNKKWFGKKGIKNYDEFQTQRLTLLNQRFNRWHDKQITLLTFVINLFLTLNVAALGFVIRNFKATLFQKNLCGYSIGRTASLIFLFSIIIGMAALIVRLYDFRRTKDLIHDRKISFKIREDLKYSSIKQIDKSELEQKIVKGKNLINCLGSWTWGLFLLQIALFLIGLIIIVCNI